MKSSEKDKVALVTRAGTGKKAASRSEAAYAQGRARELRGLGGRSRRREWLFWQKDFLNGTAVTLCMPAVFALNTLSVMPESPAYKLAASFVMRICRALG